MIGIIDYGCGNVGSVLNMFSKIGIWSELVTNPDKIDDYSALVLPGVGTFDKGVEKLKKSGFWEIIDHKVREEKLPILGICLGMQLFFEGSEEGSEKGFGWINGTIQKFDNSLPIRIPHMGWNTAKFDDATYNNHSGEYYFVHAYHVPQQIEKEFILARSTYHVEFPSAVRKENITGFQFHPEKSLKTGMSLLEKWSQTLSS